MKEENSRNKVNRLSVRVTPSTFKIIEELCEITDTPNQSELIRNCVDLLYTLYEHISFGATIRLRNNKLQISTQLPLSAVNVNKSNNCRLAELSSNIEERKAKTIQIINSKKFSARLYDLGEHLGCATNSDVVRFALDIYETVVRKLSRDDWYLSANGDSDTIVSVPGLNKSVNYGSDYEGKNDSSRSYSAIEASKDLLDTFKNLDNISTICWYVSDPIFKDGYRLIHSKGLRYVEGIHPVAFPEMTDALKRHDQNALFQENANSSGIRFRGEMCRSNVKLVSKLVKNKPIFGDFKERENIKSFVRLQYVVEDELIGLLFLSYRDQQSFTEERKVKIARFFNELSHLSYDIRQELIEVHKTTPRNPMPYRVHSGFYSASEPEDVLRSDTLHNGFHRILEVLQEGLDDSVETEGCVYLTCDDKDTLAFEAKVTSASGFVHLSLDSRSKINTLDGDSIYSWVAIRKTTLLINDLSKSNFKTFGLVVGMSIKSVLAVPLVNANELYGVLAFTSCKENAFQEHMMFHVWMAANLLTTRYVNMRQKLQISLLRSLNHGSKNKSSGPENVVEIIGQQIKSISHMDTISFWRHSPERNIYELIYSDYTNIGTTPRDRGWTSYVLKSSRFILLQLKEEGRFDAFSWDGETWNDIEDSNAPNDISRWMSDNDVKTQIGIPMLDSDNSAVGVIWLNIQSEYRTPGMHTMLELEKETNEYTPLLFVA